MVFEPAGVVTVTFALPTIPGGVVAVRVPVLLTTTPDANKPADGGWAKETSVPVTDPATKSAPVMAIACPPVEGPEFGETDVILGGFMAMLKA